MECIYCGSVKSLMNGYSGENQRYNCKDGNRNWTLQSKERRKYKAGLCFHALKLYLEGLSFRAIGRLGVSNVTVLKWIKSMRKTF